jgi:hypothetical protein
LVDHIKSVPLSTNGESNKAKNRAYCKKLDQNNVSSECNEEQMNQKKFQSKMEESFSGFSSYYRLEGGGEFVLHKYIRG